MKKKSFLACLAAALLLIFAAPLFAQTTTPKYASKPGETYFDFGDEPIRYIENDRVKVGFNLAIGGAIVYLEDKKNDSRNMINSFDWGRQIQLSFYSGPAPFIGPNGEKPSDSWAGLGWNPIQAGDCGGYGSRVLEFEIVGDDQAFVRTRPMLWPHSGLLAECVFECRYRLTDNGFELSATIINDRSDKTQYLARSQETPALYTNAPWYKLVTYLGDKPFQNEPVTTVVDKGDGNGWPWTVFYCPERWSALLDENDYGVGVYQPASVRVTAGYAGSDESKGQDLGAKESPTGYIAPLESMILDWDVQYSYRTTFIVGSLDEIRQTAYALAKEEVPALPEWDFKTDRQNWTYENTTDDGWDLRGKGLTFNLLPNANAVAKSAETFWQAEDSNRLEIEGSFVGDASNPIDMITVAFTPVSPADSQWYLQWSEGQKDATQDRAAKEKEFPRLQEVYVNAHVERSSDGAEWSVHIDLSKVEGYEGAMRQIRLIFPPFDGKINLRKVGIYETVL
ncbi:MAG: hypothetical protein ACOX0A_05235 [Thermoguttaceae bacterium]|jgi:hypothetical protein